MLVQGPTLRDAACIWITKYDGYTPPERFINVTETPECQALSGVPYPGVCGIQKRNEKLFHFFIIHNDINFCKNTGYCFGQSFINNDSVFISRRFQGISAFLLQPILSIIKFK